MKSSFKPPTHIFGKGGYGHTVLTDCLHYGYNTSEPIQIQQQVTLVLHMHIWVFLVFLSSKEMNFC